MPLPPMTSAVVLPLVCLPSAVVVAAFTPFLAQSIAVVGQPRVEGAKPVRHSEREVSGRRNSRAVDASNNVFLSDLTRLMQA
jgi:uncharacterized MAPEG superfamily protein